MPQEITSSDLPGFQRFMRPILVLLSDGQTWTRRGLRAAAFDAMKLTSELKEYRNENGTWIANGRVHWAVTYMVQAGFIDRVARGEMRITARGLQAIQDHPNEITVEDLKPFPEFQDFMNRIGRKRGKSESVDSEVAEGDDPHESVASAVQAVNSAIATEILQRMKNQEPVFLEHSILRLMRAMGYGLSDDSAKHLGGPGDEGFDGVIHQDALGLDRVYLQAKRWTGDGAVGRPEIQKFAGALDGARSTRGVFITTGRFSQEAKDFAAGLSKRVALIDGQELAELMIQYRVGVQVRETFDIVEIDEDFFES